MLVNNMVVPAVREDQTDVDFTAEYHYVDGDIVNVACVNLLNEDKASLTMEYEMAGKTSDNFTVRADISSSKMIGFVTKLHSGHHNNYMICTNTGSTDYIKVMIRFVMLTKPNIVSISINGMILRPRLVHAANRHYEIKYLLVSHQPMNVTCEVERTDVKLLVLDDDFGMTKRTKTGSDDVTLHMFPDPDNDADRFRTWLYTIGGDILNMDNQKIKNYRKVCDRHFEEKYHVRSKRLSANAVPTLFIPGFRFAGQSRDSTEVPVTSTVTSGIEDSIFLPTQEVQIQQPTICTESRKRKLLGDITNTQFTNPEPSTSAGIKDVGNIKAVTQQTETSTELIPMKKTELSFYLNPGDNKYLACSADYVTGALAEFVFIEFTTAYLPIAN
ncbi:hypothetical protein PYW07_011421 [Mythimna separata]|uniref:THAP-type domain-containing protein n=1 Tax=Mythimna separata TaxID=271217 RepID=A0AAD8DM14_MYTSE|nr:hypothetical protein PYW07_011421 [Mythimna separata]